MRARTIAVNSISKTGNATGWRVGWLIAPAQYTPQRQVFHDTMVILAPTPLQKAAVALLGLDLSSYDDLRADYTGASRSHVSQVDEANVYFICAARQAYPKMTGAEPLATHDPTVTTEVGAVPRPAEQRATRRRCCSSASRSVLGRPRKRVLGVPRTVRSDTPCGEGSS